MDIELRPATSPLPEGFNCVLNITATCEKAFKAFLEIEMLQGARYPQDDGTITYHLNLPDDKAQRLIKGLKEAMGLPPERHDN